MSALSASLTYFECKTAQPVKLHTFYKEVMGFEVSPPQPIPFYLQVKLGNKTMMGFRKVDSAQTDQCSLYVHVEDLLAAYETLKAKGLSPTEISSELWEHPATTVKDPDGRLLVFTKQL